MELLGVNAVSITETASIKDVMRLLQESARQVVLVVGGSGRLLGLITDGDIRRGLLASLSLDEPATSVMNCNYHSVQDGYDPTITRALMVSHGIRHLPVLDPEGRALGVLVDSLNLTTEFRPNEVVIMAGGRGTRLLPLTSEVPKPMLRVGGAPILEIILHSYASQGFRNFTIVIGHLGQSIVEHFGDGSRFGLRLAYIKEDEPRGTAGSLRSLELNSVDPIIVSNADVLSSVDLGLLLAHHRNGDYALTIAARRQHMVIPYGVLELHEADVLAWREKPEVPVDVSAGVYAIEQSCLELLPKGYTDVPHLVSCLLESGMRVGAHFFDGLWIDVGTHDSLKTALELGNLMNSDWP